MSQATVSNSYGYADESMGVGSKPVASGVDKESIFETMKPLADRMSVELLEEYKAKLTTAQEKIRDLKDTCADQSVELYKIKKENEELYKQLKEKEESGTLQDFYPIYDVRMYADRNGNHPTAKWVRNLWNMLYTHSINTLDDGAYYIENSTSVAVVYKLVHDSSRMPYKFTGTYEDFSYSWNANVVDRITDMKHARMLTCVGASLKSEYNKKHWKGVSIGKLESTTSFEGQHGRMYGKANVIIRLIMPDILLLATG